MGWRGGTGPTIDTGTLEYLACLAAGSETIAFYLVEINKSLTQLERETKWQTELKRGETKIAKKKQSSSMERTFLFRQLLQFIDSRGSAVTRRGVSRSMLTVGRADITIESHSASVRFQSNPVQAKCQC
jgi:hypothetical protein